MNDLIIACITCAKNFQDAGNNAAGYSILFLLVVVLGMLGFVGFFMVRLARRSARELDPELQDDFQIHRG